MINQDLHQKIKKLPHDYAYLANLLLTEISKGNKAQTQIMEELKQEIKDIVLEELE